MARRADLLHLDQQAILIAIQRHSLHVLKVPAGLTLEPKTLARPAPIGAFARLKSPPQRLLIHPSHHQHLPILMVLNDRGDQAIGVVFQVLKKGHGGEFTCGIAGEVEEEGNEGQEGSKEIGIRFQLSTSLTSLTFLIFLTSNPVNSSDLAQTPDHQPCALPCGHSAVGLVVNRTL